MRNAMLTILMTLFAAAALAQDSDSAIGNETANADQAKDKAEPKTVAAANAGTPAEMQLPPGFRAKKRGDITLYCIKGKATGTRFQTESCYDEAQLKDYLLAREQNNRDFDRSRSICSDPGICAPK
jgi:hypothetical protein